METSADLTIPQIRRAVEAMVFAAGHPLTFESMAKTLGVSSDTVASIVREYALEYNDEKNGAGLVRGVSFLILGNACQLATKEEFAPYIKDILGIRDGGNLSRSSLETLAIIAYNQPITRAYIEQVRGVDSTYSIGVLIDRELIEVKGRLDVPGRPRLYGTTENFLRCFGLQSIEMLPAIDTSEQTPFAQSAPTEA